MPLLEKMNSNLCGLYLCVSYITFVYITLLPVKSSQNAVTFFIKDCVYYFLTLIISNTNITNGKILVGGIIVCCLCRQL